MTGTKVLKKRMSHDNLGLPAKSKGGDRSRETATAMTSILRSMSLCKTRHAILRRTHNLRPPHAPLQSTPNTDTMSASLW